MSIGYGLTFKNFTNFLSFVTQQLEIWRYKKSHYIFGWPLYIYIGFNILIGFHTKLFITSSGFLVWYFPRSVICKELSFTVIGDHCLAGWFLEITIFDRHSLPEYILGCSILVWTNTVLHQKGLVCLIRFTACHKAKCCSGVLLRGNVLHFIITL